MVVRLLGKRWNLKFVPRLPKGLDGDCDPITAKNRTIRIHKSLTGLALLETIIHECTHASDDTKTEEWVTEFAHDLAVVIEKLGYRREE